VTNAPDDRGAELRELFFETSQELLQALNEEALKLEKKPGDEEIVRVIRRTVHTLKGDSAACGLRELSELAHQFEDALSLEGAATQAAVAEIAFNAADIFTEMIAAYRSGKKVPSTKVISKRIQELTSAPLVKKSRRKTKAAVRTAAHWTEYENVAMARAQASGLAVYQVVAKIDAHCAMPIAGRQLIHNAIASVGQILAVRPDAIVATNTSSISITKLATATDRPDRFIGMHFFNPVPLMALLELIRGLQTSDDTHAKAEAFAKRVGKVPITAKNSPGFAVNRILCPMINEAIFALQEGIATAEDIDAGMKLGCNHPIGPLALADMIGLDTMLSVMEVFYQGFNDPKYRAAPLLKEMVDAGHLGRKTGQGFYSYGKTA